MKHLKRLALSFILMSALSVAAFAGETESPPCVRGETNSPPCPAQSVIEDPLVLDETNSPTPVTVVDVTDLTQAVLFALSLF